MEKRRLQIFISSTYKHLKPERQAAVQAVLTAGHIPAGMELFTSEDKSQMEVIKEWIDESDIFLLILGGRYGSIEPITKKSYIELEYDYALEKGKPLFACVINEDALEEKVKKEGSSVFETENPKLLKEFREKILTKISKFWNDSKDIKIIVGETLSKFEKNTNLKGWVRPNKIIKTRNNNTKSLFLNRRDKLIIDRLEQSITNGKEILAIGIGNNLLTQEKNLEDYKSFFVKGKGKMRIMFLSHYGNEIKIREKQEKRKQGSLIYNVIHNIEDIIERVKVCKELNPKTDIIVKTYDFRPNINLILIDRKIGFIQHYGYNSKGYDNPVYLIEDKKFLNYYLNEFELMWKDGETFDLNFWEENE